MSGNLIGAMELAGELAEGGSRVQKPVVVDCRFNLMEPGKGLEMWREGHIPGAFYAHLDNDLASPVTSVSGRHPLPDAAQFAALLGSWGVTPERKVVVYDDAGGAIASRLWWLLRWAGHKRVVLLDGGLQAWQGDLSTDVPVVSSSGAYPVEPGQMPVLESEEMGDSGQRLVVLDARDAARYRGEIEPIDPVAGHVPGVDNRPFQANLDERGRFIDADELQKSFAGIPGWAEAATRGCMCGSGVTACHNILAAEEAGYPPPALYVGSWSEWIRDPERPLATGS